VSPLQKIGTMNPLIGYIAGPIVGTIVLVGTGIGVYFLTQRKSAWSYIPPKDAEDEFVYIQVHGNMKVLHTHIEEALNKDTTEVDLVRKSLSWPNEVLNFIQPINWKNDFIELKVPNTEQDCDRVRGCLEASWVERFVQVEKTQ